jgi:hypothetical protein
MEMPKPGQAHARLQKLVGRWHGAETLHPAPWDPAGGSASAVIENRVVLGGFAVVQEYQQTRSGTPSLSGHGLFWWDAATGEYALTWFDSMMGVPAEYRGRFEGDVLRLVHPMPPGGFSRCTFDCATPGRYTFVLDMSQDGATWAPAMEGTYARMPATRAPIARRTAGKGPGAKPAKAAASAKTRSKSQGAKARTRTKAVAARPRRAAARTAGKRGGRGGRRR